MATIDAAKASSGGDELSLEALCGDDPFYDGAISWNTDDPDVTSCFRKTVLIWIPCGFFWLMLPFQLRRLFRAKAKGTVFSRLSLTKYFLCGLLMLISTIDLFYWALSPSMVPVDVIDPTLRLVTFSAVLGIIHFERLRGFRTSWIQFLFWLVYLMFGAFNLYSQIRGYARNEIEHLPFVTFVLMLLFAGASFALHFFAEPQPIYEMGATQESQCSSAADEEARVCPKLSASFPSQLTFSWFTRLAWTGFKRSLTSQDLWALPPELSGREVVPSFRQNLEEAMAKVAKRNEIISSSSNGRPSDADVSFRKDTEEVDVKPITVGKERRQKRVKTFPLIFKTFGLRFFVGSLLKLVHDILIFASPLLLKRIIRFGSGDEELWKGVVYACLLLLVTSFQSICLSRYFYEMFAIGMGMRACLISSLYQKALRVSAAAKKVSTTGEIVNLMSVDVQRMTELMPYLNMLWSAPLQIGLTITLLWGILGPSVLAGLLVMILLIPVNGFVSVRQKTLQVKQMKEKDQRVKMMNEIVQGIKILKLYAWEKSFQEIIQNIRKKEINFLKQIAYLQAGTGFVWTCAPFLVSLVSFATFVLSDPNNILDSERAFVSLALFNILRFPLSMLPMMISQMVQASVAMKRIDKFMNAPQLAKDVVANVSKKSQANGAGGSQVEDGPAIAINDVSFKWDDQEEKACLQNISLKVAKGSLVAVVGQVGAGKSSMLSAILGEMGVAEKKHNEPPIVVDGTVAYVAQQSWIQNATVKNNILFNKLYRESKYRKVLEACALNMDLEVLSGGDQTEIGEKGINLSGGQKQRISLARAVYSDEDVFLLDDPLSAVDSHVGKHIFDKVIGPSGLLAKKTRILVTHGVKYLPSMDKIVVLKDGRISETGTYKELLDRKGDFADFLVQYLATEGNENPGEEEEDLLSELAEKIGREELESQIRERQSAEHTRSRQGSVSSTASGTSTPAHLNKVLGQSPMKRARTISVRSTDNQGESQKKEEKRSTEACDKQYEAEKAETGRVKMTVYLYYLKNVGFLLAFSCFGFFLLSQFCNAVSNVWLSKWSDSAPKDNPTFANNTDVVVTNLTETDTHQRNLYLGVYGGLGAAQAVAIIFASLLLFISTVSGSKRLHNMVLANILHAPMSFFDTTPQGRILNRFGKDIDVLDSTMPMILRGWITCMLAVLASFIIISYTTPIFILPVVIVLGGYFMVQKIYVATSRQLKRLESVSRSPIYSHFGETVSGASTIRAYGMEQYFIKQSETIVETNQKADFPSIVSNRWLAVRLEAVGNIIIFCASLLAVLGRDNLTPGLIGLSVSYALSVTQTLNWFVRMTSEVETNIVAAERLKEYSDVKPESEWTKEETKPKPEWPQEGKIEVRNLSTRYREGLDLVLKKLSFDINGGEKIGIVGRTGAGKSSLTLSLFRMIEPVDGSIKIDGVDISTLGLHDLRSKLTIIPQDPVLFSGTLRMNLDPFAEHSDESLWEAIRHAHLESFVRSLVEGLEHAISEGGENISVGQRQLVCLARALLRKTKILVLDEATAAIDLETDELIQAAIRKEFEDCTVITIAHRLNTIIDYTKILVLRNGEVAEYDSPKVLMENKKSVFYGMCLDAGLVS